MNSFILFKELKDTFSLYSFINASIIFFGYILQSSFLQIYFYYSTSEVKGTREWKIQNKNAHNLGLFWTVPFLSDKKPGRAENHVLITTMNLVTASLFAFIITELCMNGYSKMSFNIEYSYASIIKDILIIVLYENIMEYYWHRSLHSKIMYKNFHKYHHYYKAPEPWDDMYIHPLEAVAYYCILYSPPFLFKIHFISFLGYMVIMGLCGVIDHSGIQFSLPGIYDSKDHDQHHSLFNLNYGFPNPYLDILHGTYNGNFLGFTIIPSKKQ